jgi:Zn-dependent protease with chaperone function
LPAWDAAVPEVTCRFCGIYNRTDRVFCLRCNRRLLPYPPTGVSADDFATAGDKGTLEVLRGTEPLPRILSRFVVTDGKKLEAWLERNGTRVSPPSKLDTLLRACGEILGLDILPRSFVAPFAQMNAFTTGADDSPLLVVCAPLLDRLSYVEMEALVAHELAHVRSRHVLYHSLAESIASGAQFVTSQYAAGLLGLPVRMLLLSWYRESEISADRAATLVLGDSRPFESLMVKLAGQTGGASYKGSSVTELLQTHPGFEHRVKLAREFTASDQFKEARRRMMGASAHGALVSTCRYCGATKPRPEVFCPNCGHSSG